MSALGWLVVGVCAAVGVVAGLRLWRPRWWTAVVAEFTGPGLSWARECFAQAEAHPKSEYRSALVTVKRVEGTEPHTWFVTYADAQGIHTVLGSREQCEQELARWWYSAPGRRALERGRP